MTSVATCKRCKANLVIPELPLIVGETPPQKQARIFTLEIGTIMQHMAKEHPEFKPHAVAWANLFTEFYFLSQFDMEQCPVFLDQFDARRLVMLGLCQRTFPEDEDFSGYAPRPEAIASLYEETERVTELERAGYVITRGFFNDASGEKLVKL